MKTVLITGSTGFCGTYLSRHLVRLKKYKIYGAYFPGSSIPKNSIPVSLDITNEKQTTAVIKTIRPDYVFHLAAQSSARYSLERVEETYKVNIQGTLHLANSLRMICPASRFFYTSSAHVYGRMLRNGLKVTEDSRLWPESHYGISKALSELACLDLYQKFGFNIVIVRAVNFFGPGQSSELVFSDWCRQIAMIEKKQKPPVIEVGNIKLKRDFLFIEDAVELYERLLREGKPGEIYNVSSGKSLPLASYLHFLISLAKIPIKVRILRSRFRADDAPAVRVSNSKIKKLGGSPHFPIKEGLKLLLEDWRARIFRE